MADESMIQAGWHANVYMTVRNGRNYEKQPDCGIHSVWIVGKSSA